jgi:hypothetical protein
MDDLQGADALFIVCRVAFVRGFVPPRRSGPPVMVRAGVASSPRLDVRR